MRQKGRQETKEKRQLFTFGIQAEYTYGRILYGKAAITGCTVMPGMKRRGVNDRSEAIYGIQSCAHCWIHCHYTGRELIVLRTLDRENDEVDF